MPVLSALCLPVAKQPVVHSVRINLFVSIIRWCLAE